MGAPRGLLLLALGLAALAAAPAFAAARTWQPEPASYGVSAPQPQTITMPDGTRLAADVYVPTDPKTGAPVHGRFPVILAQTPYGKRAAITTRAAGGDLGGDGYYPYLVSRGYVNAIVDVRGTGSSQGHFELFGPREVRDGAELVRWAARLPASDGRVGTAGESYLGINQLLTAAAVGPHSPLKATFPVTAGNDLYRDITFMGGIPNLEFAAVFAALRAGMVAALPDDPTADPAQTIGDPISRAQDYAALDARLYTEIDEGGPRAYDSPFWQQRAPRNVLARVVANRIPAFLVNGWDDVYQRGAPLNYAALQNAWAGRRPIDAPMRPGQPTTGRYQLAMGPWFHNAVAVGVRLQELQLEWFDTWLKHGRTGMASTRAPLHLFGLGPNRWYDTADWPLRRTRASTLYLGAGSLGNRAPDARAATDTLPWSGEASPCNRGVDQWTTGLGAYVAALAGAPALPCDQDERTTAAGALTYETAPLRAPLTIAGPIDATLFMTSTTPDSELVTSLEDVAPDGSAFPLTEGALLGSLRAVDGRRSWRIGGRTVLPAHPYTASSRRMLTPGAAAEQQIEVYPVVATLAPGHRLRLTITSGTTALEPTPAQLPNLAGGVYAIQRHAGAASRIEVPVASPADLRPSAVSYGPCNAGCHP